MACYQSSTPVLCHFCQSDLLLINHTKSTPHQKAASPPDKRQPGQNFHHLLSFRKHWKELRQIYKQVSKAAALDTLMLKLMFVRQLIRHLFAKNQLRDRKLKIQTSASNGGLVQLLGWRETGDHADKSQRLSLFGRWEELLNQNTIVILHQENIHEYWLLLLEPLCIFEGCTLSGF